MSASLRPGSKRPTSRRAALRGGLAAFASAAFAIGVAPDAAASVAGMVSAEPSADEQLHALCRDYVIRHDLHLRTCAEQDAMRAPFSAEQDARWSALDDFAVENAEIMGAIEDSISDLVATTPAGRAAKASMGLLAARHIGRDEGGPLARSLARDVVGVML